MKTLLMGHSDNNGDQDMHLQATFHHNWFSNTDGRNPSLRFGHIHYYNNYLENISDYGLAIRNGAHAKIENCHFESVNLPIATDKFKGHGYACVSGSLYTGSCTEQDNQISEPTGCDFWETMIPYEYSLEDTQTVALSVTKYAGVGKLHSSDTVDQDTTSVNMITAEEKMTMHAFYSPVESCILIDFHTTTTELVTISLYSSNGTLVSLKNYNLAGVKERIRMEVPNCAPGLYILGLQDHRNRITRKIILN